VQLTLCTHLQAKLEGLFAAAGKALQGSVDIAGFDQFLASMPNRLKPTEQRILIAHLHRWALPDSAAWTFQDILQAGPHWDPTFGNPIAASLCCSSVFQHGTSVAGTLTNLIYTKHVHTG
jgi:hypothetical protein